MKKGMQNMTHSTLSDSKRTQKTPRLMLLTLAIIGVMTISLTGPAQADWADQMGEGSGVDRGVMLAATTSSGQSQQQNMDTAALREAMASSLTSDLAGTLGAAGAMPTAYHATGIVVPSIAANDGDDGMGDLG
jgi:hypothetical protein